MKVKKELGVAKKTVKEIQMVKELAQGGFVKKKIRKEIVWGGSDTCQVQTETGKTLTL